MRPPDLEVAEHRGIRVGDTVWVREGYLDSLRRAGVQTERWRSAATVLEVTLAGTGEWDVAMLRFGDGTRMSFACEDLEKRGDQ